MPITIRTRDYAQDLFDDVKARLGGPVGATPEALEAEMGSLF